MKAYVIFALPLVLAGCAVMEQGEPVETAPRPGETTGVEAPPPPKNARTVEQFDTTSAEARAEAATPSSGGRKLGSTIVSLGDPAQPGFWIETELVTEEAEGRVEFPEKGTSAEVTLRPSTGGSSRISLAALRLLEAPLTDLSEVVVYLK